jgi:hypothetical protein
MQNPVQIEEAYKEFASHLADGSHDGIAEVDLKFLHDSGLLDALQVEDEDPDEITQYFHVLETYEKVTLFNEQFIVWIIPKMEGDQPCTYVMIAWNPPTSKPRLEIVFATRGIYNTPRYVLKVLQYHLLDLIETDAAINSMEKKG